MKSEYSALAELLIAKGVSDTETVSRIKDAVLEKFRDEYPKSPADAAVLVNEKSGDVMIFSGNENITPPKFGEKAAAVARQVMIEILAQAEGSGKGKAKPVTGSQVPGPWTSILANLFFWGYNIYFALFNLGLVFSFFTPGSLTAFIDNLKNLGIFKLFFALILIATPLASMYLTLRRKLYTAPGRLLRLFFLFELPVVFACLLPLAMLGQTTPFSILFSLAVLALPGIIYLYTADIKFSGIWLKAVFFIQEFVFIIAAYLGLLLAFVVPVILGGAAKSLFDFGHYSYGYGYSVFQPEMVIGFFLSMGLNTIIMLLITGVLSLPYLILMFLGRAVNKTRAVLTEVLGKEQLFTLEAVFAVIILTLGAISAYQPTGSKLLDPLRNISTSTTFEAKEQIAKDLTPQEKKLKTLVANISRARSRYLTTKDDKTIQRAYEDVFDMNDTLAGAVNSMFLTAAYPLVYQGESRDSYQLGQNFYYIFGYSPFESTAKTKTSIAPVPASANNVLLNYRKVTVTPDSGGLTAKIAIEEEYTNSTSQQQEVLYEFTLPRGAVMTGLKLGPDLEFEGIIAPKGAAQKTYEQQLQVRRDPALLEETGPRQYRLRVFPVPAKNDYATLKGRRQKVRFEYAAAATPEGFPLPEITRKTNVYTTGASQIMLVTDQGNKPLSEKDTYIPLTTLAKADFCQGTGAAAGTMTDLLANQQDFKSVVCADPGGLLGSISGLKIAVFYDVSAENRTKNQEAQLKILGESKKFLTNNKVDLYKYSDLPGQAVGLTADNFAEESKVTYFGKSNALAALNTFSQKYDLVLILTGNAAFAQTEILPFAYPTQVYLVHPQLPPAYTMKLASKLLQTGGDATGSLSEALKLYVLNRAMESKYAKGGYLVNDYVGATFPVQGTDSLLGVDKNGGAAAALVNKGIYRTSLTGKLGDISGDVSILDKLHAFAREAQIVTVYSSLISLVNAQQLQTLEQLQQQYNRYEDRTLIENRTITTPPMELNQMELPTTRFGSIGSSLFNVDMIQTDLKSVSGGGGNFGGISGAGVLSNPSASFGVSGGGMGLGSLVSGLPLFLIANALLLAFGLGFYIVRLLRHRK